MGDMHLAQYIVKRKTSVPAAAAELGCTRGYLWRVAKRWSCPRPELAAKIVSWSGGKVRLQDLMDLLPDRPRRLKA